MIVNIRPKNTLHVYTEYTTFIAFCNGKFSEQFGVEFSFENIEARIISGL